MRFAFALGVMLLLSACRDASAEAWARAEMAHEELLTKATRPEDPKYDAVLADLNKVEASSKYFARAQDLKKRIEGARVRVRTPLALAPKGTRPALLEAQLVACARLAQMIGQDGGVNRPGLEALEACRRSAEKMELEFAHADEDAGVP